MTLDYILNNKTELLNFINDMLRGYKSLEIYPEDIYNQMVVMIKVKRISEINLPSFIEKMIESRIKFKPVIVSYNLNQERSNRFATKIYASKVLPHDIKMAVKMIRNDKHRILIKLYNMKFFRITLVDADYIISKTGWEAHGINRNVEIQKKLENIVPGTNEFYRIVNTICGYKKTGWLKTNYDDIFNRKVTRLIYAITRYQYETE